MLQCSLSSRSRPVAHARQRRCKPIQHHHLWLSVDSPHGHSLFAMTDPIAARCLFTPQRQRSAICLFAPKGRRRVATGGAKPASSRAAQPVESELCLNRLGKGRRSEPLETLSLRAINPARKNRLDNHSTPCTAFRTRPAYDPNSCGVESVVTRGLVFGPSAYSDEHLAAIAHYQVALAQTGM